MTLTTMNVQPYKTELQVQRACEWILGLNLEQLETEIEGHVEPDNNDTPSGATTTTTTSADALQPENIPENNIVTSVFPAPEVYGLHPAELNMSSQTNATTHASIENVIVGLEREADELVAAVMLASTDRFNESLSVASKYQRCFAAYS